MAYIPFVSKITRKFRHKIIFHRNFSPNTLQDFDEVSTRFAGLVSLPLPAWAVIAINKNAWENAVIPDPDFVFHLWFPDVAMQMMRNNLHVCLDTNVKIINDLNLKAKYGQLGSVEEGRKKSGGKMEKYGAHLDIFEKKWNFDYEWVYNRVGEVRKRFKGTIIEAHLLRNSTDGPLKIFMDK